MSKLVTLKIGQGSFEQGFPVTLQIGEEGAHPTIELTGLLPPAPEMPLYYSRWQTSYRRLGLRLRLSAPPLQVTNVSVIDDCRSTAQMLKARLNTWLRSEEFRDIRERWLERLLPEDVTRVILQTEDTQMQRLPWHLLEVLDRFPKTEIAISAPRYEQRSPQVSTLGTVKILAVLGNQDGIDVASDQETLKQLPNATIEFLVEPSRQELTNALWKQPWDIFFFAGHSSSQGVAESGQMYLNQTDQLSIVELKYAMSRAVEQGLRLAIFNSCDGLGLARELADLHIPQVIVMREPVPDLVAQEFLKGFLEGFAKGEPLYLAVRDARERLQGLEDRFPCATWLPMICQNPAELPPTWNNLVQGTSASVQKTPLPPASSKSNPTRARRLPLFVALGCSLVSALCISGVRWLGALQPIELAAFDQLMRLRPSEGKDPRLFIVTINEADIVAQRQKGETLTKQELPGVKLSLSDRSLSRLLAILQQYKPKLIGLDLYRDFAIDPSQNILKQQLQTNTLVGICKVDKTRLDTGIAPPPDVPRAQLGFSDFVPDSDNLMLRRHLLWMKPWNSSRCQANYAFSTQLALGYLAANQPAAAQPTYVQAIIERLQANLLQVRSGGYQGIDPSGQILLNYRAVKEQAIDYQQVLDAGIAEAVPLFKLFQLADDPQKAEVLRQAIENRIVLIGVTQEGGNDWWPTPYGQKPGVVVHAHMISQILSAVLDDRPLLQTWTVPVEWLWIGGWTLVGSLLTWLVLNRGSYGWLGAIALGMPVGLSGLCLVILVQGHWVPLIPSILGIFLASGSMVIVHKV